MIIPYFVMKPKSYGLWNYFSRQSSAPMFCIVADIDITDSKDIKVACGKHGNPISLKKQHLLSSAMKQRLETHGFLMGLDPRRLYENWFLIFKNEKDILRSIHDFFIKGKIKYYSSQAVWNILPVFYRYTQLLRGKMGFYEDEEYKDEVIGIERVLENYGGYNRDMGFSLDGYFQKKKKNEDIGVKHALVCVRVPPSKHIYGHNTIFTKTGWPAIKS